MSFPRAVVEQVEHHFADRVPHNRALGLRLVSMDEGGVVSELPYDEKLVGNPDEGVIHGGAISTQIDATCGMAIPVMMRKPIPIATLDLRIDYLKPAPPGASVMCRATCYKTTTNVAFVRASADAGDPADPIASAAGTFIIFPTGTLPGDGEGKA